MAQKNIKAEKPKAEKPAAAPKPEAPKPEKPVAQGEGVAAPKPEAPKKFKYQCPACTNTAIETSNKMLGVKVTCQSCKKDIKLDDKARYQEL